MTKEVFGSIFGAPNMPHVPTLKETKAPPPQLEERKEPDVLEPDPELTRSQIEAARLGTSQLMLPTINAPI